MDLVASAVMQKEVKHVPPSMSLAVLEAQFAEHRVSGFAVVEEERLMGVVSRSDLLRAISPVWEQVRSAITTPMLDRDTPLNNCKIIETLGDHMLRQQVREIMTTDVVTVRPNEHLHDVADRMYQGKIHRVFVVEDGLLRGVLTPFDFVRLYATDRIAANTSANQPADF